MPRPKKESRGIGLFVAFLLWVTLFAFLINFSTNYVQQTQALFFTYDNGKVGTAFYYASPNVKSRPAPVVLYIHGYNNLKTFEPRIVEFTRLGWDVITIDLPGHGTSPENFTSGCWKIVFGALDLIDAHPDEWNRSAIGVVGHSFGGLTAAMGILFDSRIAAGVLWAPALDLQSIQARDRKIFPNSHPLDSYTNADSPLTYLKEGYTLNNTLILQGTADQTVLFNETFNAYHVVEQNDPANLTHHSFQAVVGDIHTLNNETVIRQTIAWLAPYLQPDQANLIVSQAYSENLVYPVVFDFEILIILGFYPAIIVIFIDQIGKAIAKRRRLAALEAGEEDEYPITPAAALEKRDWREYFAFYVIALVGTIYLGVNTFAQFTLPYQLGFIGVLLITTAVIFDQIQHRREIRREGLTKTEHEVEEIAGWYLIPWQARLRTNAYHFVIGLVVALALLLGIYALTYRFGFLFTYPVSWSYLIDAFIVAFLFSFGIEWVLRRRIQTLIDQVAPYYDPHKTSAIYLALIIILPASVTLSLALFDAAYLPAIFLLLFPIIGICGIINAYLYDHTNSLMVTVTFATCVIGWVLAGCLYPGFF